MRTTPLLLSLATWTLATLSTNATVSLREVAVDSGRSGPGVKLIGDWKSERGLLTSPEPGSKKKDEAGAEAIDCKSSILDGDFSISGEMTLLKPLDGTRVTLALGNPQVVFDGGQGHAVKAERQDGALMAEIPGGKIGETIQAGKSFRWEVIRTRNKLAVKIDGKKVLETVIQPGSLGRVRLLPGGNRIALASLVIQGNLSDAPAPVKFTVLPRWVCGSGSHRGVGIAPMGAAGAVAGFIGSGTLNNRICTAVHDGQTWQPLKDPLRFAIDKGEDPKRGLLSSFAFAESAVGGTLTCLYVLHDIQQQVFVVTSNDGGKSWSEPAEVTAAFRKPGVTVRLDPAWLVEQTQTAGDKALVALVSRTGEKGREWSLLRGSPDGKTWTELTLPRVPETAGGLRLQGDGKGGLWLGWRNEKGDAELHASRDGKSWKRAAGLSKIPMFPRGDEPAMETWDFAVWPGKTANDPFTIVVAMVEPALFPETPGNLLTVRVSKDWGKTWKIERLIVATGSGCSTCGCAPPAETG